VLMSDYACVNCGEENDFTVDYGLGDYICNKCGAVQPEQVIDSGREWREFENDEKSTDRARADQTFGDDEFRGLGTTISTTNFGSTTQSQTAKTLTKYSKFASTSDRTEHNVKDAFIRINELAETLQLSAIVKQTAKEVVRAFERKRDRSMRGYKKDAFIIAVLLLACKQQEGGRTLKGIARSTEVEEKEIKKFYKLLLKDPSLSNVGMGERKSTTSEVEELVEVYCNKLQLPYSVAKSAKEVSTSAANFLEGRRPSSIASSSILFVINLLNMEQDHQELCAVASVSPNTLRSVYRELGKNADQLPPHLWQLNVKKNVVL